MLVDFWAPWCGPCRMVAPIVEELAEEYDGKVNFVKLNTDDNPVTASGYSIRSIPTLLVFKGGQPEARLSASAPSRTCGGAWTLSSPSAGPGGGPSRGPPPSDAAAPVIHCRGAVGRTTRLARAWTMDTSSFPY